VRDRRIDTGRGLDFQAVQTPAAPTSEQGRGLQIMTALVDNFSLSNLPRQGTLVHFENRSISPRRDAAPGRPGHSRDTRRLCHPSLDRSDLHEASRASPAARVPSDHQPQT
jgi:hypothetical protein